MSIMLTAHFYCTRILFQKFKLVLTKILHEYQKLKIYFFFFLNLRRLIKVKHTQTNFSNF